MRRDFLMILAIILSWRAAAAKETTVAVEGVAAIIAGDRAAACDQALEDALVRAIERTLGVFIESTTNIANELLQSSSTTTRMRGFIKSYRVVKECTADADGLVKVAVEAVVSDDIAQDELFRLMKDDQLLVVADERIDENDAVPAIIKPGFEAALRQCGFEHIMAGWPNKDEESNELARQAQRGNAVAAMKLALRLRVSKLIFGKITAQRVQQLTAKLVAYRANAAVYVLDVKTGEITAVYHDDPSKPQRGFGSSPETAGREALNQTLTSLTDELLPKLAPRGYSWLVIEIRKLPDFQSYTTSKTLIRESQGVHELVADQGFNQYSSLLRIRFSGSQDHLAEALNTVSRFGVIETTPGKIVLEWRNSDGSP